MLGKRFYITLNHTKKKDKLILDFLKSNYSESETIKSILYQYAVQGSKQMHLDAEKIEKVDDKIYPINTNSTETVQKGKANLEIDDDIMNMFKWFKAAINAAFFII